MDNIELCNPNRFLCEYKIPEEKLKAALDKALKKLERLIPKYSECFPGAWSENHIYPKTENQSWINGMATGLYNLAYEITGDKKFKEVVYKHLPTYRERLDKKIHIDNHDVGFVYSPSCVAAYKIFGDSGAYKTAIEAAEYFYNRSYSKKGGFIVRSVGMLPLPDGCRTMMDTLMNIPLLFWAAEETGKKEYRDAAISQCEITRKYLIRKDFSSYHHYQFDVETHRPLYGITFQGYSDESCWSRGHAWGIYGFPAAVNYGAEKSYIKLAKNLAYFMLNNLPDDYIPYWDYHFTSGDEPRDSSAGVISICGMKEISRFYPEGSKERRVLETASAKMLESIIDNCTDDSDMECDGLIYHVSAAVPQKGGVDECAIYGDYFYLEALRRFSEPEWSNRW